MESPGGRKNWGTIPPRLPTLLEGKEMRSEERNRLGFIVTMMRKANPKVSGSGRPV
jgi:hypothetical protein